jgi:hypothetical protein
VRFGVAVLFIAASASAQPADTPPPPETAPPETAPATPAQLAFREGRELLEAGKDAEACAKFEESLKADPDAPGTMLNLGLCNEHLGKIATALRWFRKAQFRSAETGMVDYETAAKTETVKLAARVPRLRIVNKPAGAEVLLDGQAVGELDLARVEVDPGSHRIEVTKQPPREIRIEEKEDRTLDLTPPPPKQFVTVDRGATQRRNAYLLAGGGALFWGGSLTLSLAGKSKYDASDHPDTWRTWQRIVRWGGTSMFLVGSAAIGTAVYMYVKAPRKERIEVTPAIDREQVGVAIHAAF